MGLLSELGSERVDGPQDLLLRRRRDMAVEVGSQSSIALDVVEGFEKPGIVLGLEHARHTLLRGVVARGVGSLEIVLASLISGHDAAWSCQGPALEVWRRWQHRPSRHVVAGHLVLSAGRQRVVIAESGHHVRLARPSKSRALLGLVRRTTAVIEEAGMEEVVEEVELVGDFGSNHVVGVVAVDIMKVVLGRHPCILEACD